MKFNEKSSRNIHSICIMVKQWKACRWTSSGRWERKHKQKGMYHVTPGATLQKHSHSPWASDERRQRRERGRRWETGRVRGRKGREGGISNKMLIAWSVINAQILPERRGFQSTFRSQKVQSSCRGVRGRIWALICYLIMKGQFISCVYLSKWEAGGNPDNTPPCFCEQRKARYIFRGFSGAALLHAGRWATAGMGAPTFSTLLLPPCTGGSTKSSIHKHFYSE